MHPRILAQRQAAATERMVKAARKLARHHGLKAEAGALEGAQARMPAIQMMLQTEAIADLLEAVTARMTELVANEADEPVAVKVPQEAVGTVTVETIEYAAAPEKAGRTLGPIGKARKDS